MVHSLYLSPSPSKDLKLQQGMKLETSGTEHANQLCKSLPLKVILDGDYDDDDNDNDNAYNDEIVMMMMDMPPVKKAIGTLRSNDATVTRTSLKKVYLRSFSLYRDYSYPITSSNVAEPS